MRDKQKTIFFVVATKFRINFILRTEVFKQFKSKGYRVVIISPFYKESKFIEEFGGGSVSFEPLPKLSRVFISLDNLRSKALSINHPRINFARRVFFNKTRSYRRSNGMTVISKKILSQILLLFLLPLKGSSKFWDFIEQWFVFSAAHKQLFDFYQPSAVILASAGAERNDLPFIVYAKKFGIPHFAVDNNIDAFEFRYQSYPRTMTKWMMLGEPQKRDAMEMQRIPEKDLVVTGSIRCDHFFRKEQWLVGREEFFKKISGDPKKKLITFATKGPQLYPFNGDIIRIILAAINQNFFGPAQLFVSFDPKHDPSQYGDLLKEILWETVDNRGDQAYVANLLYHSDVVISVGSTIAIEACFVGTPAIWVGFDGFLVERKKWWESCKRTYELGFWRRLLKLGAVPLAQTPEELVLFIKRYLENKNLDKENREKLLELEYNKASGGSGKRIAEEIFKFIP